MPKRSLYPGSVYAQRGKLWIKYRVQGEYDAERRPLYRRIATGLDDSVQGRKLAELKKQQLFINSFLPEERKPPKKRTMRLSDAFEQFMTTKQLLPKTITNYRLALQVITRGQNYILNNESVEMDVVYFKNITAVTNGYSSNTINSYLTQFQVFLNFCTESGWIGKTKIKSVHRVRGAKTEIKIFTNEEIQLMLADLQEYEPEFRCLIELMVETGARPVDALNLRFSQWRGNSIVWSNKITKLDESTPISRRVQEIMQEMRAIATGRDKTFRWNHSSLPFLTKKLNECMHRCGIEKNGRSFKHFRTTFKYSIRHLPFELQMKLMRHSKPDVTLSHYTYYDNDEISARLDSRRT